MFDPEQRSRAFNFALKAQEYFGILILSLFHKNFLDLNSSDSSWL